MGDNPAQDVLVVDLTAHGCRLLGIAAAVSKAERLTLWLGSAGPIPARLKWAKKASVGVAFDTPLELSGEDLSPPPGQVLPLRAKP